MDTMDTEGIAVGVKYERLEEGFLDVEGILINPPWNNWKKVFLPRHLAVVLSGEDARIAFTPKQLRKFLESCPGEKTVYAVEIERLTRVVDNPIQFKQCLSRWTPSWPPLTRT